MHSTRSLLDTMAYNQPIVPSWVEYGKMMRVQYVCVFLYFILGPYLSCSVFVIIFVFVFLIVIVFRKKSLCVCFCVSVFHIWLWCSCLPSCQFLCLCHCFCFCLLYSSVCESVCIPYSAPMFLSALSVALSGWNCSLIASSLPLPAQSPGPCLKKPSRTAITHHTH